MEDLKLLQQQKEEQVQRQEELQKEDYVQAYREDYAQMQGQTVATHDYLDANIQKTPYMPTVAQNGLREIASAPLVQIEQDSKKVKEALRAEVRESRHS